MKKYTKLLVIVLVLVSAIAIIAACTKADGIQQITILATDMPKTQYVVGQELDLSAGKLTVRYKDSTKTVEMTNNEVTHSGYNKDVLGEQTVIIKYQGKTIDLPVTVVPRIQIASAETDYFVGETELDRSKGSLKLNFDDGTSETVQLSNPDITFSTPNFSTAVQNQKITVEYKDFEGEYYVNVYAVTSVTIKEPTSKRAETHLPLSLAGGSVTLKGGNGVTKPIGLKQSMISGYKPEEVVFNEETKSGSAVQKIKITYAGTSIEYNVTVTFSDVSIIWLRAEQIEELEKEGAASRIVWDNGVFNVSGDTGKNAFDAASRYSTLSEDDKTYVEDEQLFTVSRVAAAYAYPLYKADLLDYSKLFTAQNNGIVLTTNFELASFDFDDIKSAVELLKNTKETPSTKPLFVYGETLSGIMGKFGDTVIATEPGTGEDPDEILFMDFMDQLLVPASVSNLYNMFQFMIEMYEAVEGITPFGAVGGWKKTWDLYDTKAYADAIKDLYSNVLVGSGYTSSQAAKDNYRNIYKVVSKWRAAEAKIAGDGDFVELLYYYYYTDFIEDGNSSPIYYLMEIILPSALEQLHGYVLNVGTELGKLERTSLGAGTTVDATAYRYSLALANEIIADINGGNVGMTTRGYGTTALLDEKENEVKDENGQTIMVPDKDKRQDTKDGMLKYVLKNCKFIAITDEKGNTVDYTVDTFLRYLRSYSNATNKTRVNYYTITDAMLGNAKFDEMWDTYLAINREYLTNEAYRTSDGYYTAVEAMLKQFLGLNPYWQVGFLMSINPFMGPSSFRALDFTYNAETKIVQRASNFAHYIYEFIVNGKGYAVTSDKYKAFSTFMLEVESYALYCYGKYVTNFGTTYDMDELSTKRTNAKNAYNALDESDKTAFEDLAGGMFGTLMNKLKATDGILDENGVIEFDYGDIANTTHRELFYDFSQVLKEAAALAAIRLQYLKENKDFTMNSMLFSAVIRAEQLYNQIYDLKNETLNNYLYYGVNTDENDQNLSLTYYMVRSIYADALATLYVGYVEGANAYLYDYLDAKVIKYYQDAYYMIYAQYANRDDDDHRFDNWTTAGAEKVQAAMKSYRAMGSYQQGLFGYKYDSAAFRWYYTGTVLYFEEVFKDNAVPLAAAKILCDVEAYIAQFQGGTASVSSQALVKLAGLWLDFESMMGTLEGYEPTENAMSSGEKSTFTSNAQIAAMIVDYTEAIRLMGVKALYGTIGATPITPAA